jgi:hypothetical protein
MSTEVTTRMSSRATAWLAWCLWALYIVVAVPLVILTAVNDGAVGGGAVGDFLRTLLFNVLILLVMMTVGALVASRRPRNAIGWLFCGVALASETGALAIEYAVRALVIAPGSLPAGVWIGLFAEAVRSLGWYLLLTFLLLLFPTGKLPSPRWRPVAWFSAVSVAVYSIISVLVPDAFANTDSRLQQVVNPISLSQLSPIVGLLEGGSILLAFAATLACGVSLVTRFRHSHGVERQQLKWIAYTVVCSLVIFAAIVVSTFFLPPQAQDVAGYGFEAVLIALPVATGIAMLRYRLWDIDVIIRRTLIYGTLTAILAGLYLVVVVAAQLLGARLTGQTQAPAWLIVVTTLAVAALFAPLRRRVQRVIDQRFYRSRYDAARTIEGFAATLRTELDLTDLGEHLVSVVDATMRPQHVSLWLNPTPHVGRT